MTYRVLLALPAVCLVCLMGCLPQSQPPVVEGTLDTNTAAQLQSRIRSANGAKYSITHSHGDQEFAADWELSNALKKASQLQIRPSAEWSEGDLYQALVTVLEAHESKPWYGRIDDTVLRLMREAIKEKDGRASDVVPDSPYAVAVTVKKYSTDWFLEVKVQILDEDGTAVGF